jgi:NADH-quinone oxidoreductase subunit M
LNGFIGEFLIILGSFAWKWPYAAVAATGVILSAIYMLWMVQRVYYGPVTNQKNQSLPDLEPREWAAALPLVAAAILMGVLPTLFLKPTEPAVAKVVQRLAQGASFEARAATWGQVLNPYKTHDPAPAGPDRAFYAGSRPDPTTVRLTH